MVHDLVAVQVPLLEKAVRSILVYLFLVAALRLGSLLGGLFGAAVLLVANYVVVRLGFSHPRVARVLEGSPTVLVEIGKVRDGNLRRYMISRAELLAAVRRQGARRIEDVDAAVLEANGSLTVELHDRNDEVLRRLARIERRLASTSRAASANSRTMRRREPGLNRGQHSKHAGQRSAAMPPSAQDRSDPSD